MEKNINQKEASKRRSFNIKRVNKERARGIEINASLRKLYDTKNKIIKPGIRPYIRINVNAVLSMGSLKCINHGC